MQKANLGVCPCCATPFRPFPRKALWIHEFSFDDKGRLSCATANSPVDATSRILCCSPISSRYRGVDRGPSAAQSRAKEGLSFKSWYLQKSTRKAHHRTLAPARQCTCGSRCDWRADSIRDSNGCPRPRELRKSNKDCNDGKVLSSAWFIHCQYSFLCLPAFVRFQANWSFSRANLSAFRLRLSVEEWLIVRTAHFD